jgi:hypothetical protein
MLGENRTVKIEDLLKDVKEYNKQNSKAIYSIKKVIVKG